MTLAMLQSDSGNMFGALFGSVFLLFWLAVVVVMIIGGWKVFEKAGQPGWAVLVPFYNAYILLKIAGRPGWWLILYLIPLVNIVIGLIVSIDIAKAFGQSAVFGVVLLFLLCGIGFLVLGFGNYRYQRTPMTTPLRA
jgi:Ca2+/Na+ antiporter